MDRHYLTIWIAGVMIGTGSGLVVARSVTDASPHSVGISKEDPPIPTHSVIQPNPILERKFLANPLLPSMATPEEQKKNEPVAIAPQKDDEKVIEPRRINPESASPLPMEVQKEVVQPVPEKAPTKVVPEKTTKEKEPDLSRPEFRKALEETAPKFTEKELNEVEAIRSIIEMGETELPKKIAPKPEQVKPKKSKK